MSSKKPTGKLLTNEDKKAVAAKKAAPQAAKPKTRKVRYVTLTNGERHELVRQDGKYYYCTDTTIRLADPRFAKIETETVEVVEGK